MTLFFSLVSTPSVSDPSLGSCLSLTEGRGSEERCDSQSSECNEAGAAVRLGQSGLGLAASDQSAAVLLLLWWPWRVSGTNERQACGLQMWLAVT